MQPVGNERLKYTTNNKTNNNDIRTIYIGR